MKKTISSNDVYLAIKSFSESEIKIKSSRFIGIAYPTKSPVEAHEILQSVRDKHYDATHNCFAWAIGKDQHEIRYSDDGEPAGSAGKPIMNSIYKFDLSDVIVVVTRYYGGTKLGVGGLMRAYGETAELALEKAETEKIYLTKTAVINVTYEEASLVRRFVDDYAIDSKENYTEIVSFNTRIPQSLAQEFKERLFDASAGKIIAEVV